MRERIYDNDFHSSVAPSVNALHCEWEIRFSNILCIHDSTEGLVAFRQTVDVKNAKLKKKNYGRFSEVLLILGLAKCMSMKLRV